MQVRKAYQELQKRRIGSIQPQSELSSPIDKDQSNELSLVEKNLDQTSISDDISSFLDSKETSRASETQMRPFRLNPQKPIMMRKHLVPHFHSRGAHANRSSAKNPNESTEAKTLEDYPEDDTTYSDSTINEDGLEPGFSHKNQTANGKAAINSRDDMADNDSRLKRIAQLQREVEELRLLASSQQTEIQLLQNRESSSSSSNSSSSERDDQSNPINHKLKLDQPQSNPDFDCFSNHSNASRSSEPIIDEISNRDGKLGECEDKGVGVQERTDPRLLRTRQKIELLETHKDDCVKNLRKS